MNDKDLKKFEKIQQYLDETLSPKALKKFKSKIKKDASLAEDVQIYKKIPKLFKKAKEEEEEEQEMDSEVQDLQETLQKLRAGGGTISTFPTKKILYIATFAIGLVAIIGSAQLFFFSDPPQPEPQRIYAFYAQHDPLSLTTKSDATDSLATNIETAFNQQDYSTVLQLSPNYLQNDSTAYDVLLAQAVAAIELNQFDLAATTLETLRQSDVRVNQADWYTALMYLKMENLTAARQELEKIVREQSFNYVRAQELLEEL